MVFCGEAFSRRTRLAKRLLRGTVAMEELERQSRDAEMWSLVKPWLEEQGIEVPSYSDLHSMMVCRVHEQMRPKMIDSIFAPRGIE